MVPFGQLVALIEPVYPKSGDTGGHPVVGVERMLRLHCPQPWVNLSDPAVEETRCESASMRAFVGIDLGREPVPYETTVMRFRPLLEKNGLGEKIFREAGRILQHKGMTLPKGHDSGRHDHLGAGFHQEQGQRTGPEMRQVAEGQSVVFRDEDPRRGRPPRNKVICSFPVVPANAGLTARWSTTNCCTAMNPGSTGIRPTTNSARESGPRLLMPRTSPTAPAKWKGIVDEMGAAKNIRGRHERQPRLCDRRSCEHFMVRRHLTRTVGQV